MLNYWNRLLGPSKQSYGLQKRICGRITLALHRSNSGLNHADAYPRGRLCFILTELNAVVIETFYVFADQLPPVSDTVLAYCFDCLPPQTINAADDQRCERSTP